MGMHANSNNQEAIEKIRELIKDIKIAMLTTVSEEGLVSRPMKTQDVDFDGSLWFLTKKDTDKFHELLQNKQVNVAYADKSFVSIRGVAELVDSTDKIKEFWNKAYEEILETTYDDPSLVLIKVDAEAAEYWDSGNKFKMVKFLFNRLMGKNTEGTELNQTVEMN
ncbi:pyridoxamine 5'-phosphate oxidase family protein [Paenibacillus sp. JDR-2]|uniref:pyridoxamine 5'-phosphate oxidase family protein n=1 Tax=Paenibacillus sp. (strain JDR-2) TaxID=324057 RepID=UPI0001663C69|nr:pyridoxamine 5'-phosphate oxidase-related FMN-binding [Paenibacillus sp. JDR-2]